MTLTRHERPIYFFGLVAGVLAFVAALLALPVGVQYLQTGMVPRLPTLFVASFLVVISSMCVMVGLVLDGMRKSRHEVSRLSYMRHPAVRGTYVQDPAPATTLRDAGAPMVIPVPRSA